jgi:tRNA pseudouridine13 synthase
MVDESLPPARFKERPEDFVVEEIPAYPASGSGEHVLIEFKKRLMTTEEAVRAIARALGADPRAAGYAGQKDKYAVTTQRATFQVPIKVEVEPLLARLEAPGIEILSVTRHNGKLKPGHLRGNRFVIVLRELEPEVAERIAASLRQAASGFPNAFGPQRFGREGDNPSRALAWISGAERPPKDRREQRLLFSSLQSLLFNELLAIRVADGSWNAVLPGDLVKKHDTGGLFLAPLTGPELEDAQQRASANEVSATGPIFGASMRWPDGEARAREEAALSARGLTPDVFNRFSQLGEGTRRPLRVLPEGLGLEPVPGGLRATFVLPKGAYATTVLASACRLVEVRYTPEGPRPQEATEPSAGPSDT